MEVSYIRDTELFSMELRFLTRKWGKQWIYSLIQEITLLKVTSVPTQGDSKGSRACCPPVLLSVSVGPESFVSLPGDWLRIGMWWNLRQQDSGGGLSTMGDCWRSFLSSESKDLPLFAFKPETEAYQSLSLISLSQGWLMESGVEAHEHTAGPSWPGWILHFF